MRPKNNRKYVETPYKIQVLDKGGGGNDLNHQHFTYRFAELVKLVERLSAGRIFNGVLAFLCSASLSGLAGGLLGRLRVPSNDKTTAKSEFRLSPNKQLPIRNSYRCRSRGCCRCCRCVFRSTTSHDQDQLLLCVFE